MNLQPKNNLLIIKEPPRESTTSSGIVIPDIANRRDDEQVAQGEILAGNDEYPIGTRVLFHKVLPIDATIEDETGKKFKVWFLKSDDVLAVINHIPYGTKDSTK